jgi:hypothetical protein
LYTEWVCGWETQEPEGDIDQGSDEDITVTFRVKPPAPVRRLSLSKVAQEADPPLWLNGLADHVGDEHVLCGDDWTPDLFIGDATISPLQGTHE